MSQISGIAAQLDVKLENKRARCSFQPENMLQSVIFSCFFNVPMLHPRLVINTQAVPLPPGAAGNVLLASSSFLKTFQSKSSARKIGHCFALSPSPFYSCA